MSGSICRTYRLNTMPKISINLSKTHLSDHLLDTLEHMRCLRSRGARDCQRRFVIFNWLATWLTLAQRGVRHSRRRRQRWWRRWWKKCKRIFLLRRFHACVFPLSFFFLWFMKEDISHFTRRYFSVMYCLGLFFSVGSRETDTLTHLS